MASLSRAAAAAALLAGCSGELLGLEDDARPLATVAVELEGELAPLLPAGTRPGDVELRVALVWGGQAQPQPLCFLPPETPEIEALVAAGCPDPLGFVPARVGATSAVVEGRAWLELFDLPSADLLVGPVTGRVGYGSVVVFDDRNGNGTLDLREPEGLPVGDDRGPPDRDPGPPDVVYGASFATMSEPDVRLAYLEGTFDPRGAFYPREGCPAPPTGFSLLGAGGFSLEALLASLAGGGLPAQPEGSCTEAGLEVPVVVTLRPPGEVSDLACEPDSRRRATFGIPDFDPPPDRPPPLDRIPWACVPSPSFGGAEGPRPVTLSVAPAGAEPDPTVCRLVQHFALRGCYDELACDEPEWDRTASPPAWWPCPAEVP